MKIPTDEHFGAMVREYRESRKWSMTEFSSKLRDAGLTNFHPTTVSRLERGERAVKLGEAYLIAQVLRCPLEELLDLPFEPWEESFSELKEWDERVEWYAQWSAYWTVRWEIEVPHLIERIEDMQQKLDAGLVPDESLQEVAQLLEASRLTAKDDQIDFWTKHIRGLDKDARDKFRNR